MKKTLQKNEKDAQKETKNENNDENDELTEKQEINPLNEIKKEKDEIKREEKPKLFGMYYFDSLGGEMEDFVRNIRDYLKEISTMNRY